MLISVSVEVSKARLQKQLTSALFNAAIHYSFAPSVYFRGIVPPHENTETRLWMVCWVVWLPVEHLEALFILFMPKLTLLTFCLIR